VIRVEETMKEIYCYESIQNEKGEFNSSFTGQLPDFIEEKYPIRKFEEQVEKFTVVIHHSEGQTAVDLLRCRVDKLTIFGNQMIMAYRNEGLQCYKIFQRYLLHGRQADITIGHVHEFILMDNLLFIREITKSTADAKYVD